MYFVIIDHWSISSDRREHISRMHVAVAVDAEGTDKEDDCCDLSDLLGDAHDPE